jgi:hypothetical protein
MEKEGGGSICPNLFFAGKLLEKLRIRIFSQEIALGTQMGKGLAEGNDRIAQDGKIRSGTDSFDRVGRIRIPGIKMSDHCGGQMPTGGKSQNANPLGPNAELRCPGPNSSHRSKSILHRGRMSVTLAAVAIINHKGCYS